MSGNAEEEEDMSKQLINTDLPFPSPNISLTSKTKQTPSPKPQSTPNYNVQTCINLIILLIIKVHPPQ